MNNAAMNIGIQMFFKILLSTLLDKSPEVELLDHIVNLFYFFEELLHHLP